jgi:TRAP-type C4-dicarboxylate transport system substrate-binding protein
MSRRPLAAVTVLLVLGLLAEPVTADYKPEFKLSVNLESDRVGPGATRFADVLRHRTQGRIRITPYFDGQLFAGKQTTELLLLQEGGIDFAK